MDKNMSFGARTRQWENDHASDPMPKSRRYFGKPLLYLAAVVALVLIGVLIGRG